VRDSKKRMTLRLGSCIRARESFSAHDSSAAEDRLALSWLSQELGAKLILCRSDIKATAGQNLLQVRTYDCFISYDKHYQTPRFWLFGYDEVS
jgi:hypothetical protein